MFPSRRHVRRKTKEANISSLRRINERLKHPNNTINLSNSLPTTSNAIDIHCESSTSQFGTEDQTNDSFEDCYFNEHISSEDSDGVDCHTNETTSNFLFDMNKWAVEHNVKHVALNALLKLLSKHFPKENIPSDSRTLLSTPKTSDVIGLAGGEYYHFGVREAIVKIILHLRAKQNYNTTIELLINTDGAPTGKSTEKNLWPILLSEIDSEEVYPVGIHYGEGKPSDVNEFLEPFVDELVNLLNKPFEFEERVYTIKIKGLICDAPAKAMVLNVTYPSGYHSCTKCEIEGTYIDRVCFPTEPNTVLRTDDRFRENYYLGDYQNGETVLTKIPLFGPVSNVPLDYMHLICLGVMRKLLFFWTYKPVEFKLSLLKKQIVSDALMSFRQFIPSDFSRIPRPLKSLKHWKATEYRHFLLYYGPIVLKDVLSENMYLNFLSLHIAITILASPYYAKKEKYLRYSEELLKYFVNTFTIIYGAKFVSHNVHNLLHLVNDVRSFGHLDRFSAFRFENSIFKIKNMIRKYEKPLQQIARRFAEKQKVDFGNRQFGNKYPNMHVLEKEHCQGPVIEGNPLQYKIMRCKNYVIDVDSCKNDGVMVKNVFVKICNFVKYNDTNYLVGKQLLTVDEIYKYPCKSSNVMSYIVKIDETLKMWLCADIKAKLCKISHNDKLYVFPLVHTHIV